MGTTDLSSVSNGDVTIRYRDRPVPHSAGADPARIGKAAMTRSLRNGARAGLPAIVLAALALAGSGVSPIRSLCLLAPAGLGPEIDAAFLAGLVRAEREHFQRASWR